jgi:hypothetical protein
MVVKNPVKIKVRTTLTYWLNFYKSLPPYTDRNFVARVELVNSALKQYNAVWTIDPNHIWHENFLMFDTEEDYLLFVLKWG